MSDRKPTAEDKRLLEQVFAEAKAMAELRDETGAPLHGLRAVDFFITRRARELGVELVS